ncbi:MAG: TIGR00180 family glycosyltransferase, partial [Acidobacteria bacterium]|nr:TIGR00180 family glycosyltransferase [Acidobacteriota bacterium]
MSARDLTLLLALKDRTPYTFRWMAYHNFIRLPFRVFVADGGADECVPAALSERAGFPNLDFEYVRYPYDATCAQYYAKLADALERIHTPFVALADNDDLFVVKGLQQSIEFLASHPDYSACGGQCAVFWIHPDQADADADVLYGPRIEWKCSLERTSLTDDTASARLLRLPRRTAHAVFYHVRRTEDLRRELRLIRDAAPQ